MKKMLLLILIAILSLAGSVHANSDDPGPQVDAYLTRLAGLGFSGSVLIVDDGEIILNEGYGLANSATGVANTPDTIFANGSITKLYTMMAILQLHEMGQLDVMGPISDYLGDVPDDKAGITVQQLLTHTSGLTTYHDTEGDFQLMARTEAYDAILHTPLEVEPGTEEIYSNSGYTLLAILIEEVSGQTYQDYLRDHIFTPLNMTRTGFREDTFNNMAYTRNDFDGYGVPTDWDYTWVLVGNGGMVTTNADHYRFITALFDYELVSAESTALWFDLSQIEGWVNVAGGGDALDYNASIYFNLDKGIFIYAMTNTIDFPAEFVNVRLAEMLEGAPVPLPPAIATVDSDACYAGQYLLASGGTFTVTQDDEGLLLDANGQDAVTQLSGITSPELLAWYAELNANTAEYFTSVSEGDFSLLAEALQAPTAEIVAFWSYMQSMYGEFGAHDMVGTTMSQFEDQEAVTIVRLAFADADAYVLFYWDEGNTIIDFEIIDTSTLAQRRLYPTADDTFTTFNLFSDANLSIEFLVETGDAHALRIATGSESIEALLLNQECE